MAEINVQDIFEAGVVGAGGAGFPTHVKLAGKADTVLVNAAECEPLLHKDKEVLRTYVDDVVEGHRRCHAAGRGAARSGRHQGKVRRCDRPAAERSCRRAWTWPRFATPIRPATSSSWSTTCCTA